MSVAVMAITARRFRRRPERCAVRRLAHAHVTDDVFDLHDGVVDEDTGHQRDGEQAYTVEREAQDIHRPKRREHRERQRDRGNQGGSPISQEQEYDEYGQGRPLQQGVHGGVVAADGGGDGRVDLLEGDVRMRGPEFGDALLDAGSDFRVAGATARHSEGHDGFAVEPRKRARLFDRIGNGGEVVEANSSAGHHDGSRFQVGHGARSGKRTDGLFAAATSSSAGHVRRREAEPTVHVGSGDAQRQQTVRLKRHAHLTATPPTRSTPPTPFTP
jgi:hypothetical protein